MRVIAGSVRELGRHAGRGFLAAIILCMFAAGQAFAQKWITAAPVPQGAEEVYGIAAGGKLYVFGGLALAWKPIGMVMEYDPATESVDAQARHAGLPPSLCARRIGWAHLHVRWIHLAREGAADLDPG